MLKMAETVLVEREGPVTRLTLNNPSRGNALSAEMVETLHDLLDDAAGTSAVVLFRGEGKHFCTGFDLTNLESETDASLTYRFIRIEEMLQKVAYGPFHSIVAAQGRCMGAGADLFCACKERLAAHGAKFAFPGARFGLNLGRNRLTALVGEDAMRHYVEQQLVTETAEAFEQGLVTRIADPDSKPPSGSTLSDFRFADTRDEDLAALVRSAALPGLKSRISNYVNSLKAAKT